MDNGACSYRRFRNHGDEDGLVEIIRTYRDGLILYLCNFVGNLDIAEELAEDVFVLLGTKKPRDKGTGSFKTWLYTIGRNKALNYLKHIKRHPATSLETCAEVADQQTTLETGFLAEERKILLHKAMQKLKPEYRQILWLIYFEEMTNQQAAQIMKKSVHSVETLVYRARKSLKSQLEKEDFHYEEY